MEAVDRLAVDRLLRQVELVRLGAVREGDTIPLDSDPQKITPAVVARHRGRDWILVATGHEQAGSHETFWFAWEDMSSQATCFSGRSCGRFRISTDGVAVRVGRRWFALERRPVIRERWVRLDDGTEAYVRESTHTLRCVYVDG